MTSIVARSTCYATAATSKSLPLPAKHSRPPLRPHPPHLGMDAVAVFTGGTGPVSGTPARAVLASASKNKRAVTGGKLAVHTRPLTAADGRRRVN
jgi:hypothetical protein